MKVTQRTIAVKTGAEGPREDPYGYTVYRMTLNGRRIELRTSALGYSRLSVGIRRQTGYCDEQRGDLRLVRRFEKITGLRIDEFERANDRLHPYFDDPMGNPRDYI